MKLNNIVDLFYKQASERPNQPAIIHGSDVVSFGELKVLVHRTAQDFESRGISSGDRVLVFVPMSIDLYRICMALFHIGATAVFLDPWVNRERLGVCCDLAECKGFVGVRKARIYRLFLKPLRQIPIHLPLKVSSNSVKPDLSPIKVGGNHPALITFTTGSTGIPKAAERSHGFLYHQFQALHELMRPDPKDVDMPLLPIVLFCNLGEGCTSVIPTGKLIKPNAIDPKELWTAVSKHGVSRITASPFPLLKLAEYVLENELNAESLIKAFTGGGPVFPNEASYILNAFPKISGTVVYGSTEAEPISEIDMSLLAESELTTGLPVGEVYRETKLQIVRVDNDEVTEMNVGEVGEIIVSGDHVLDDYFRNPEAEKEVKLNIDGQKWHRTGDAGFVDVEGNLYLVGRVKQLISRNGGLLSPFLYEHAFQSYDGVVCGTLLEIDEKVIAIVESERGADQVLLREKMITTGLPVDDIIFIKSIPRDPRHHTKIDYEALKEDNEVRG